MEALDEILKHLHASTVAKLVYNGIGLEPIKMNKLMRSFFLLIRSDSYKLNLDKGPLVFIFNKQKLPSGNFILKSEHLNKIFDSGSYSKSNVIYTNYYGEEIKTNPFKEKRLLNLEDVSDDYKQNAPSREDCLYILVIRDQVIFVYQSKIIRDIPDIWSYNRIGELKGRFHAKQYRAIVNSHYKEELIGEKGLKYWAKKNSWELIKAPEQHFRKRLMHYAENNTSGSVVDEECMSDGDRTDIRIVELATGDIYILEVKWMGKSEGSNIINQKAHDKANEGIDQLHTYLSQEPRSIVGLLVMYDAREDKVKIKWDPEKEDWNVKIDKNPILPSLDPTTASSKAQKAVRARKKIKKESK